MKGQIQKLRWISCTSVGAAAKDAACVLVSVTPNQKKQHEKDQHSDVNDIVNVHTVTIPFVYVMIATANRLKMTRTLY